MVDRRGVREGRCTKFDVRVLSYFVLRPSSFVFPIILLLFLSACGFGSNAELIVEACVDQAGNPLPEGVTVTVAGRSAVWQGEPLVFPVRVKGDVGLVPVDATLEEDFHYLSKPEYDVRPGTARAITLHFFKPYSLTVETGVQQAGLDVYANGQPIGTTQADGTVTWRIDHPNTPAGIARPGTRFDFAVKQEDTWTRTDPVILAAAQYTYDASIHTSVALAPNEQQIAAATPPPDRPQTTRMPGTRQPPLPAQINQSVPIRPALLLTEAEREAEAALTQTEEQASDLEIEPMQPPEQPVALPAPVERTPASSASLNTMQQADRAFEKGQYDEALLYYEQVPASNQPAYKHALGRIGEIRLIRKNYEGAIGAYTEILQEDPSEYAAHHNLAAVYLATESYEQALDHLDQVLAKKHLIPRTKRRETEWEVRYIRATIYYTQFQKERDPITKREQGLLAMGVLRTFLDRVPEDDPAFAAKRQEIAIKLDDARQWVKTH